MHTEPDLRPRRDARPPTRCQISRWLLASAALVLFTGCPHKHRRIEQVPPTPLPAALPVIDAPAPLPPSATQPIRIDREPLILPPDMMLGEHLLRVELRVAVDAQGRARQSEVRAIEAPDEMKPRLAQVVQQAAHGWRFEPARVDGRAVPAWATVSERLDLAAWWAAVTSPPPMPEPPATPARPLVRYAPKWPAGVSMRPGPAREVLGRIEILPSGAVRRVWIVEPAGERAFDLAALATLRTWRYVPARDSAGAPVLSVVQVRLIFKVR